MRKACKAVKDYRKASKVIAAGYVDFKVGQGFNVVEQCTLLATCVEDYGMFSPITLLNFQVSRKTELTQKSSVIHDVVC